VDSRGLCGEDTVQVMPSTTQEKAHKTPAAATAEDTRIRTLDNADYSRMVAELFLQRGHAQIIHYGTGSLA
jgi:hypothetical protein